MVADPNPRPKISPDNKSNPAPPSAPNATESWGSRLGVIMAVTGSAVGLGNFLRFPGLAAQYEGGAFMIPYFVALLLLGLPIAWAEWAMGRYGGSKGFNSIPGIFRAIWKNPASPYMGALGLLIPVAIYMYYVYIEAWCIGYAWNFLAGDVGRWNNQGDSVNFFNQYVGINQDGEIFDLAGKDWLSDSPLVFLVLCFGLNFVLIYRGLTKGIEWFCKWAMPALAVCALIVLVRVLTLGTPDPALPDQNILNGLGYTWNPHATNKTFLQSLGNAQMWLDAAGQIFFSLSIGFGIIACYASYLKPKDDVALSGLTSAAGNEFCEVALGGMITIPAAFIFLGASGALAAAKGGTFNLGFKTLPLVFHTMPAGRWIGAIFFFLLFLAAVTSSLSMLQPAIALLEEGLGLKRKASVVFLGFITAAGTGFIVYFSKGMAALGTIDFWVGTFSIYVLATIQVLLFGWVMGIDRGYEELMRGAEIRVPRVVMYVLKYISPVFLLGIFSVWLYQQATAEGDDNCFTALAKNRVAQLSVAWILLVLILFLLLIAQSVKRWEHAEQAATEVSP